MVCRPLKVSRTLSEVLKGQNYLDDNAKNYLYFLMSWHLIVRQERQRIKLLDLSTYTSSDIKLYLVIEFLTAKPLQYKIMPVSLKNGIDEAVKINFIKFLNLNKPFCYL